MCDTIVALGSSTDEGYTFFGKNSDREPDEVQNIMIFPAAKYNSQEQVTCTYITIPQAKETARVFLCQPFWMFGAEMGANEYGVVIGNEAIFTREKPEKEGLTGMDLVRLGLERSHSAREALTIIIKLLEEYGQGGNCGYRYKLNYMNSFIIADEREAFVLETVKRWWAWKKIEDYWSISNVISLEQDFDECAEGLISNAIGKGYCKDKSDFNFKKCYSDPFMTRAAGGIGRERRSRELLKQKNGKFTVKNFMEILRDHGEQQEATRWSPDKGKPTLCLHSKDPLINRTQSVCSLVAKIGKGEENHFYYTTGASNPCLSPFFPIFSANTALPVGYLEGTADYSAESYWWESEKFHRQALQNFPDALLTIKPHIEDFEEKIISDLEKNNLTITQELIDDYFRQSREIVGKWGSGLEDLCPHRTGFLYRYYWQRYNRINKLKN